MRLDDHRQTDDFPRVPGEKILVVDDEDAIRLVVTWTLLRKFVIVTASGSTQAQQCLLEHPDICAVICDYKMPDGTGLDLYRWLRQRVDIPFLLITGVLPESPLEAPGFHFLQKPFEAGQLMSQLDLMIGKSPA